MNLCSPRRVREESLSRAPLPLSTYLHAQFCLSVEVFPAIWPFLVEFSSFANFFDVYLHASPLEYLCGGVCQCHFVEVAERHTTCRTRNSPYWTRRGGGLLSAQMFTHP